MKTTHLRILAAAALAGLITSGHPAAAQSVERPLSDFLDAQGTFDLGIVSVPPVPNFLGATDPVTGLGMSVDYAGVANAVCDDIAGTTFAGEIHETPLPDGRALVSVELHGTNVITWVVDGTDFTDGPVVFGTRWEDVGGECVFPEFPTLGESELKTTFIIPEPGAPLPDSLALAVVALGFGEAFPDQIPEGLELITFDIEAKAFGELTDGTPAKAETQQVSEVIDGVWVFFEEKIELDAQ